MGIRVLCTGDVHIGRRSSKVTGTYSTADAWSAIVDAAIQQDVDLLAISGDVIDKENKSYEAIGALQNGLARLAEAGIESVAVTGNHDHDVLARVVKITDTSRFRLLGVGGEWERYTLEHDGVPVLHVDGWSFPNEHVPDSPIRTYPAAPESDVPVLGLLHGDVGAALSRYAPIHLDHLWAHQVHLWLLGHIHSPRTFELQRRVRALYPGSPWAMDPGEPGVHGVWLAEIGAYGAVTLKSIPLSPVRYETVTVDMGDVDDETGFQRIITGELTRMGHVAIADDHTSSLKVVSARLRCVGRSKAHRSIPAWIEQAVRDMSPFPVGAIHIEIEGIASDVHPPIELEELARGTDPTAETAKLILALGHPELEAPYENLVRMTLDQMISVYEAPGYASLVAAENVEPTESDVRALLEQQAWSVLSGLVAQKGSEG